MKLLTFIAALISGFLASMGVGGGMILIIWLTAVIGAGQLEAQGINLVFFIPIALISVILHRKNGMIEIKKMLPAILVGIVGAVAGSLTAGWLGSPLLRKIFGCFIIIIGIKSLFAKSDDKSSKK